MFFFIDSKKTVPFCLGLVQGWRRRLCTVQWPNAMPPGWPLQRPSIHNAHYNSNFHGFYRSPVHTTEFEFRIRTCDFPRSTEFAQEQASQLRERHCWKHSTGWRLYNSRRPTNQIYTKFTYLYFTTGIQFELFPRSHFSFLSFRNIYSAHISYFRTVPSDDHLFFRAQHSEARAS